MLPRVPPVWICLGDSSERVALKQEHLDHTVAGLWRNGARWRIELPRLEGLDLQSVRTQTLLGREERLAVPGRPFSTFSGRPEPVFRKELFANIVYFPSEGRTIVDRRRPRAELLDMMPFNWVARFERKYDLDSILLTVKAREPERFEECLRFVNLALKHRGKSITGFGENGRLVVEGTSDIGRPYRHAIEELSSGEKQILLMIGFTIAFLRPGGILLIDEPDLHIHIAMVDQLLETLELIVQERAGQLIVASHSPQVWDWFSRDEERIELGAWQGARR